MRQVLQPHKITGIHSHILVQLICFQVAGRKAKVLYRTCSKQYIKLFPSHFLGNMSCRYFQFYHSFNPTLAVWHWRKAGSTPKFLISVNSWADTDSITYPGISKLYLTQLNIKRGKNHPQRPINKVVLPTLII